MKKLLFLAICSLFLVSKGQVVSFMQVDKDSVLKHIQSKLPAGWIMHVQDSFLIIEGSQKYVLLDKNCDSVNEKILPPPSAFSTPRLVFLMQPKWNFEKYSAQQWINDSIWVLVHNLPHTMGIGQLIDRDKSTRFKLVFNPRTKHDKELIEQYEQRKKELTSFTHSLPDFNTDYYSLFLLERTGIGYQKKCVYPSVVNEEANKIYILFLEYAYNPLNNR